MKGLGRLAAAGPAAAGHRFIATPSHAYSTFSGGGRGRGRGADSPHTAGPLGKPPYEDDRDADADGAASGSSGLGHGQVHLPVFPSFSQTSHLSPQQPSSATGRGRVSPPPPSPHSRPPPPSFATGRGRGSIPPSSPSSQPPHSARESDAAGPKRPIFFCREDYAPDRLVDTGGDLRATEAAPLPPGLSFGLPRGAIGRGKPAGPVAPAPGPPEENRHLRPRSPSDQSPRRAPARPRPSFSPVQRTSDRGDAAQKAMDILSRGGRGQLGRGLRGRGDGWRGRGGRFGGRGRGRARDPDEYYGTGLYLGDNADGEKLAKRLGEENMGKLKEAFEEMSGRVLPSPMDDAYLEALHTNYSFEFEPEYHLELNDNPDIDEKPPLGLPEALDKMKPFLMEYEGITSQEEWEEALKETMEKAPLLKEIVDFYSGPDRVTAKQQCQELERVGKILPGSIPSSVKRFTDRAILSLQSNPGWGFGKKCQFMDKLVWEVAQHYK